MKSHAYPWPATALMPSDMRSLYEARESDPERKPITHLIAEAVRVVYGSKQPTQEECP